MSDAPTFFSPCKASTNARRLELAVISAAASIFFVLVSTDARGQEQAPVVAASADGRVRNHDGFYLRLALGVGYLDDKVSVSPGATADNVTKSGSGVVSEVLLGGTPVRGLAVGGGVQVAEFAKPKVASGTGFFEGTSGVGLLAIGAFGDWYFDPNAGLHLQFFVGFGRANQVGDESYPAAGDFSARRPSRPASAAVPSPLGSATSGGSESSGASAYWRVSPRSV